MRIIVLGAGHVGRAIVDALYEEHEVTVVDIDADRLQALADRYDVRTVEGNGTTKRVTFRPRPDFRLIVSEMSLGR